MRALVLYHTRYGNTEKVSQSLAKGLREAGVESECIGISEARIDGIAGYDLLAVGAPTEMITASRPMKEFLQRLKDVNLRGKYAFAFDTKLESRLSGSAAKFIEKKLRELGLELIRPRSSAIIYPRKAAKTDRPGENVVLKEGAQEQFESIGKELGLLLQQRVRRTGSAAE